LNTYLSDGLLLGRGNGTIETTDGQDISWISSDIGRLIDNQWVFYGLMLFNNTHSESLSLLNNSIGISKSTFGFWNRLLILFITFSELQNRFFTKFHIKTYLRIPFLNIQFFSQWFRNNYHHSMPFVGSPSWVKLNRDLIYENLLL